MSDPSSEVNPLDQLAEEFVERYRCGERPALSEYVSRHPELADEIRDLFPGLVLMEGIRPETGEATGPYEAAAVGHSPRLERLGDYRILREAGRGGMGIVYEAEQTSLGRHVALKVLPGQALLDPQRLQRFRREAKAAARLHHTSIVPIFGVGEADGLHYYVMQFIQGQGLDQVLAELRKLRKTAPAPAPSENAPAAEAARSLLTGKFALAQLDSDDRRAPENKDDKPPSSSSVHLPGQAETASLTQTGQEYWRSVARVGIQVADALAYAHSQGIVHRDVKPSNLLLDTRGTVWVADFGLAKATDSDDLTHTGDIVGTLRYMAPERLNGQTDARGDIYSLGLTLYELLTFRPAFQEADRNRLLDRVLHDPPPAPRKVNPEVPRDLETVVLKAVARDPAQRYQTATEMAEDLERYVEDRPIRARRATWRERSWRWCRRNPAVASLLALVVVVFLAGFGGVVWQWQDEKAARADADQARKKADENATEIGRQLELMNKANDLLELAWDHKTWFGGRKEAETALTQAITLKPDHKHLYVDRGLLYGELGLFELAAADFGQALALQESQTPCNWYFLAVLQARAGDVAGYCQTCQRMLARFGDTSVPIECREIARTCCLLPDAPHAPERTVTLAERSLTDRPVEGFNCYACGLAHYRAGHFERAIEYLRRWQAMLSQDNLLLRRHPLFAMAYHRLGRPEEAREALADARQANEEWLAAILKGDGPVIVSGPPWWDWLHFRLARKEAEVLMGNPPPPDDDYRLTFARGRSLAVLGRKEESRAELNRAIAQRPDDSPLRLASFRVLGAQQWWPEAEAVLEAARALRPGDAQVPFEACQIYLSRDQPDKAMAENARAVALRPRDTVIRLAVFYHHANEENWAKADAECERVLKEVPGDAEVRLALGQIYVGKKQYAKAAPLLAASVKLRPDKHDAWNVKAICAYRLGQWRQAADDMTEAIRRQPNSHLYLANRGTVRLMLEEWDGSAEDLAQAIRLNAEPVHYHRGFALACLGGGKVDDYRKACAVMRQGANRWSNDSDTGMIMWTCTLGPADPLQAGDVVKWIEQKRDTGGAAYAQPIFVSYLGRALYRAGQLEAARSRLKEVRGLRGQGAKDDAQDCLFLAMIQHRLGHAELARQEIDRARAAAGLPPGTDPKPSAAKGDGDNMRNWLGFCLLYREAEAVLKGPAGPGKAKD